MGANTLSWLEGAERSTAWQKYLDEWAPLDDPSRLADDREPDDPGATT